MKQAIVVVGGYGQVGSKAARHLAVERDFPVIIAGRNAERAAACAAQLGHGASARRVDLTDPSTYDAVLDGAGVVLMCADLPDAALVARCLACGIHYVDLTGERRLMKQIMALKGDATAVISVGLMPGLSNLLAKHAVEKVPGAKAVETALLLGMGEEHGTASLYWTFGHLSDTRGHRKFDFGAPYGRRMALRYAFPDQYTLPHTLGIESASSWMCMDSVGMTRLMGLLRQLYIAPIFKNGAVMRSFARMADQPQGGSEGVVLTSRIKGAYQAWIRGAGETRVTARMGAEVAARVAMGDLPRGVYHSEQVFRLEEFLPHLGLTFEEREG